jgi:hypothetical protein
MEESPKPLVLMVDRKFTAEQLKIRRNQDYANDLLACLRIFKKWGYDIIWVDEGRPILRPQDLPDPDGGQAAPACCRNRFAHVKVPPGSHPRWIPCPFP